MTSTSALTAAAVLLAGLSAALVVPGAAAPPGGTSGDGAGRLRSPALAPFSVPAAVLGLGLVLGSWLSTERLMLAAILGAVGVGVARLVQRGRDARSAERRSDQVLAVCEAMASDLAAGQPPLSSLDRAALEWPEFAPVAVAGRLGANVPAVLRELSGRPGARELRTLAATWQVAHDTGSGLADAIGQAADAIRSERRTVRLVAAELASAHATARMLAVLPLGVLLMGSGIGGDPIGFLTGSTPGLACLALGLGLSFAGLLWLERIAGGVLRR
jgi:tight adherence protein B